MRDFFFNNNNNTQRLYEHHHTHTYTHTYTANKRRRARSLRLPLLRALLGPSSVGGVGGGLLLAGEEALRLAVLVLVEDDVAVVLDEAALAEGAVERAERVLARRGCVGGRGRDGSGGQRR